MAPLVAAALGTGHRDLDQWIEADAGRTIPELFATEGEAAFRDRERVAMAAALAESPMVISPGGGWAAEPGNLALAEPRALTLYLYVSPEVAAGRLGPATDRPLLRDAPLPRLRELLDRRERWYRLAGIEVDAEGAPEVVVEIRSPDDESYEKLAFYAALGVPECWIIERDSKHPEVFRLAEGTYLPQPATENGWVPSLATDLEMRAEGSGKFLIRESNRPDSQNSLPY